MKHILNDLSAQEKNSILEKHTGTLKVMTENFSKLVNSKLGDSKPILAEQSDREIRCNPEDVQKVLSILESSNSFQIEVLKTNPNYLSVKDADGKPSCVVKRNDIFKI